MAAQRGVLTGVIGVVVLALFGCGGVPGSNGRDRLREQADQALVRYAQAAATATPPYFVPVDEWTGQLGDWEPASADNNKIAALTVRVALSVPR